METLQGTITRTIFQNEESGFKVLKVKLSSGPMVTITGEFGPDIISNTKADFHGDFRSHPKYGTSFKVSGYKILHNVEELDSIKLFIDAISPNIGSERSSLIINHFGSDTIKILDLNPERLIEVNGIGKKSAQSLAKAWKENRTKWEEERQQYSLRAFLNALGIKERRVKKIIAHFGGSLNAEETIKNNPYILTEIEGFGFTTADFIAKQLGVAESDPARLRAFILYGLNVLCPSMGHLFLTMSDICEMVNKYCKDTLTSFLAKSIITIEDINKPINGLINEFLVIKDQDLIYSKSCYLIEEQSAIKLTQIFNTPSDLIFLTEESINKHIENFERENQIILSKEQRDALHYFVGQKVFILTGSAGTGKCLGYNTPVLMYDGTIKRVQDIIKGDLLMGDDSLPRNVLSVCRGKEEMFEVIPKKGTPYSINKSHILSLKETGKNGKKIDISLMDYLELSKHKRQDLKGYRVSVNFLEKPISLDPYLLGYWLGNGAEASSRISCPFPEVISFLSEMTLKWGLSVKKVKGDNVDYDISCDRSSLIYKSLLNKRKPNSVLTHLKEMNLLFNKHIPYEYKVNNRDIRLRVLAGLIDSDGYLDRNMYEITFKSKALAEDITFLARSLGFSCYIKICKKKWNSFSKGKRYQGEGLYYRMHICGEGIEQIPCVVLKKKARRRKQKKSVLVTGIQINPIGVGDYYGFEIDGNGRFLLGDFTVTHNTTVLKAIVDLVLHLKLRLTCLTPTGISAKKLAETIKYDAYTIHRCLGFRGTEWIFGENNKYETDVVIIDEASMVDQEVFFRLLSALKPRVHVIFVGDHNQLPSVGAGNVLRELINCEEIPVVKLEQIFRQDEASDIIKVAHQVKNGNTDLSLFKQDPKSDVVFIRRTDPVIIEDFIIKLADKFKSEGRTFQIITPRNQGPLSVDELNNCLQKALNPGPEEECPLGKFIVRKGDRVIIIKNDYELNVFNGEIGKVVFIGGGFITIQFISKIEKIDETGEVKEIEKIDKTVKINIVDAVDKVKLAYSISVHRAQGQEYPYVILPFINQYGKNMLQRNLLYTAITRAKKKVIILGHGSAIEKAINNSSVYKRNTLLGDRIKCLQQKKKNSMLTPLGELVAYQDVM